MCITPLLSWDHVLMAGSFLVGSEASWCGVVQKAPKHSFYLPAAPVLPFER